MPRFVIQKHHASRLHWDLRLEMDGVLKSWAMPKEPTMDPTVKRLAIEVEDHALDYIDFEGEIAEGQYGAGQVRLWDKGEYEVIEREPEFIRFQLKGTRLSGPFKLVKMRWEGGNKWLFIKGKSSTPTSKRRPKKTES